MTNAVLNTTVSGVGKAVSGTTGIMKDVTGVAVKGTTGIVKTTVTSAMDVTGVAFKGTTGIVKSTVDVTGGALKGTMNVTTAVGTGLMKGAGQATNVMTGAVQGVGNMTVNATLGTMTTTVGALTGVAAATTGAMTTVMRSTMINPRRKNKYSGGRRLKRQDSKLAWDSRVTAPYIKLDLVIECQRLPKKNSFSQADAFCCIWEIPPGHRINTNKVPRLPARHEKELGRTEVFRENRNPRFSTSFRLEYKFQEEQHFVIRVYNEDLKYSTDLKEHDFIGGCFFTLGELMGAGGCSVARPLQRGKSFLILIGQEIVETREVLEFRFSGQDLGLLERKRKLKNLQIAKDLTKDVLDTVQKVNITNILDNFSLYFRFEKLNSEDQTWKTVWKSEVIKDSQNPTWNSARIPLQLLCDDDPNTTVKITIWDWNRFAPDVMVGFVETTINDLVQKSRRGIPVYNVMTEVKRILRGIKLKKAGILKVLKADIQQIPSMLQYISGGCRMDLLFAVDCTTANGDWRDENSQHYHSSTWLNDYQAAIHKIATVFSAFEGDKHYTVWGYGAKVPDHPPQLPVVIGDDLRTADELIEAYDRTFHPDNTAFELGDDAYLQPIIQAAMYRSIKSNQEAQCYTTLVILTTGQMSDVSETIDVICAAAEDAPLSIIIIGVGTDDFQFIELLIGVGEESGKLKHSNGVPIARELVSFVTFHEFSGNASQCVVEALKDVPEQFVQYFTNSGIMPLPPKPVPDFTGDDVRITRKQQSTKKASRKRNPKVPSPPNEDDDDSYNSDSGGQNRRYKSDHLVDQ